RADRKGCLLQPFARLRAERVGAGESLAVAEQRKETVALGVGARLARSSVFDGMHAQYEHSPPASSRSTKRETQVALDESAETVPAGRAAADDDHVVVAHVGSAVPACSATMYSAYQSGQFVSYSPPMRFSCSPWATDARRIAFARSRAEPNAVAAAS